MEHLNSILLVVQVLLSIALITLILLQHGKGADAGAAFGSGASGTVFGSKGAGNFLSRTTAILATLFFLVSLALGYISSHHETPSSITESVTAPATAPQTMLQDDNTAQPTDLPPVGLEAPAATTNNKATKDDQSDLPPE